LPHPGEMVKLTAHALVRSHSFKWVCQNITVITEGSQ